jgi:hypothetical protein
MKRRLGLMRPKVILSVLVGLALLLTFGVAAKDAKADAIMFPWIVKSDTVSTLISLVNTCGPIGTYGGGLLNLEVHYEYWYKESTANGQTETCDQHSDKIPTSKDDIITFDASCNINHGDALFNDPSPYGGASFCLNETSPRRAFLLVDNNTPQYVTDGVNVDGTLYGEAIVMEIAAGAAWGYIAYNSAGGEVGTQSAAVSFIDTTDLQGEVVWGEDSLGIIQEYTQTVLLPPDVFTTKMFVTPISDPDQGGTGNQREGDINTRIQLRTMEPLTSELVDGIYDSDENPMDGTPNKNIVCTSGDDLSSLINPGNYNSWTASGENGWAFVVLSPGDVDANTDGTADNPSSMACIGKLEYTTAGLTVDGTTVPGAVNNFVWLRNNFTLTSGIGTGINLITNVIP